LGEPFDLNPMQNEPFTTNRLAGGDREYRAHAFGPSAPGTPKQGKVRLVAGVLRFENDETGVVELPLAGLVLEMGGWDSNQAVFTHPSVSGWSVFVTELGVLEDPTLSGHPALQAQARVAGRKKGGGRGLMIAGVILALLVITPILLVVANRSSIARSVASKVPVEWERELGERTFAQIRLQGQITDDPEALKRLERITGPLLKGIGEQRYTFQFHISKDTNINAFAMPGGHVVVNMGLLNAAGRPEEVAGVLAHEIAHVTQRHSLRQIVESAGTSILVQSLFGDAGGLLGTITSGSQYLLQQKFSRDFEREADDVGWDYLVKAKVDPRGMIEFFKRLEAMEKSAPVVGAMNGSLNFLSTHPATRERIEYLEGKLKSLGSTSSYTPLK